MKVYEITNFKSSVEEIYSFLLNVGFVVNFCDGIVVYSGQKYSIIFYHGRSSYELGVEFLIHDIKYSLDEVLSIGKYPDTEILKYPTALNDEELVNGLVKYVKYVKICIEILNGNDDISENLRLHRLRSKVKFSEAVFLRQTRPKAEDAFRNKNYKEALLLYESIFSFLTPVELKKLEYCKNRM